MTAIHLVAVTDINYPDGPLADALEAQIEQCLPDLPGLEDATTPEERLAVYARAIGEQRAGFVAVYGDAFGTEKRGEARDGPRGVAIQSARSVIRAD